MLSLWLLALNETISHRLLAAATWGEEAKEDTAVGEASEKRLDMGPGLGVLWEAGSLLCDASLFNVLPPVQLQLVAGRVCVCMDQPSKPKQASWTSSKLATWSIAQEGKANSHCRHFYLPCRRNLIKFMTYFVMQCKYPSEVFLRWEHSESSISITVHLQGQRQDSLGRVDRHMKTSTIDAMQRNSACPV